MPEKKLWIIEVVEGLQSIPLEECEDPDGKLEEGDNIVGEMSDGLRRMYTYMTRFGSWMKKEAEKFDVSGRKPKTLADLDDAIQKVSDMANRYKLISEIFWECVREEFSELRSRRSIGVRRGNKVVWSEEKTEEMMAIPLDWILGSGSERALAKAIAFMSHRPGRTGL